MKTLAQQVKERISTEAATPPTVSYSGEIEQWFSKLKEDISKEASLATSKKFYFKPIRLDTTTEITECLMHNAIESLFDSSICSEKDGRTYILKRDAIPYKKTLWKIIVWIPEIDPNKIYATPTSLALQLRSRYKFSDFINSNAELYTEYNKFTKWIDDNECVCDFNILPIYGRGEYYLHISVHIKEKTA